MVKSPVSETGPSRACRFDPYLPSMKKMYKFIDKDGNLYDIPFNAIGHWVVQPDGKKIYVYMKKPKWRITLHYWLHRLGSLVLYGRSPLETGRTIKIGEDL